MTLLQQEGWTRWPTEVPSGPYYSVILWFCGVTRRTSVGAAGSTCTSHGALPCPGDMAGETLRPCTPLEQDPLSALLARGHRQWGGGEVCCQSHHLCAGANVLQFPHHHGRKGEGTSWPLTSWNYCNQQTVIIGRGLTDFLVHVDINPCLYFQYFPATTAVVCDVATSSVFLRNVPAARFCKNGNLL